MEKLMRQRILEMKELKRIHGFTYSDVMNIIVDNGDYVSEGSVKKVFHDGSEDQNFQTATIATIYNALMAKYGDMPNINDAEALKRMVKYRNKKIDELDMKIEQLIADHNKQITIYKAHFDEQQKLYAERKGNYERTISLLESQVQQLNEQLSRRDASIARKDEMLESLIDAYVIKKE